MLRYFGVLFFIAFLVVAGYFVFVYKAGQTVGQTNGPSVNNSSPKAIALGARAIRLLVRLQTDKTLIGNDKWNDEMDDIIKEWYK